MNNALDIAKTRIMFEIPYEILTRAFLNGEPWEASYPLEEMIAHKVIRTRVYKDVNIFGGKTKHIVLEQRFREYLQRTPADSRMNTGPYSLYRIPAEEREFCPIIEVHNLTFRGNYAGYVPNTNNWTGGRTFATMGQAILQSHTFSDSPPRPNVELLNGDLVRLSPSQHSAITWVLECRIAYDQQFTNLNTSAMDTFANLCVAATKAYIYNKMVIPMGRAHIESGYELGEFKSIIDSYSDAITRYQELLNDFAGAVMLDPRRLESILPYLI
jgi:hypothetical protein